MKLRKNQKNRQKTNARKSAHPKQRKELRVEGGRGRRRIGANGDERPQRIQRGERFQSAERDKYPGRPSRPGRLERAEKRRGENRPLQMKRGRSQTSHGLPQWSKNIFEPVSPPLPQSKASAPETPSESPISTEHATERLQKVLAQAGVGSRREVEEWIVEGVITVNGKIVTELGTKVDPLHDKIKVRRKLVQLQTGLVYALFHKPKGVIGALSDPEGRKCLGDYLTRIPHKIKPLGGLEYNTEGLMLLTNDGAMAEKILKAKSLPKIYMAKVKGHIEDERLEFLKKGLYTGDGVVRFADVKVTHHLQNKSWIRLEIIQGSHLDFKSALAKSGILIDRIIRIAIGNLSLFQLAPGQFHLVSKADFQKLVQWYG